MLAEKVALLEFEQVRQEYAVKVLVATLNMQASEN